MKDRPFRHPGVAAVFDGYPSALRMKLMRLRRLIFETAAATEGVGELEETLKWGQPSYLTSVSRTGSTIRIDRLDHDTNRYVMFFHCQTNLVETFRSTYADRLNFSGNRAIVFDEADLVEENVLCHCIALALTYHRRPKRNERQRYTVGAAGLSMKPHRRRAITPA